VGNGNLSTRSIHRDASWELGCSSCEVAQWVGDQTTQRGDSRMTGNLDENIVLIDGHDVDGLVVIPRQHINGLGDLSVICQAQLLAALRRATRTVLQQNPGMTTRIVAMTYPPASAGHTCFHVRPSISESAQRSFSMHA
jgi:hypothetical protein